MPWRSTVVTFGALALASGCTRLNPAFIDSGGGGTATGGTAGTSDATSMASVGSVGDGTGTTTGAGCVLRDGTGQKLAVRLSGGAPTSCVAAGNPLVWWFQPVSQTSDTSVTGSLCTECTMGGCLGCGPATATLTIEGPAGARPDLSSLPDWFRVGLYSNSPMAASDCEPDAAALSKFDDMNVLYPFYVAGLGPKEVPSDLSVLSDSISLVLTPIETCDNPNCPGTMASIYTVSIEVLGITTDPVEPGQATEVEVPVGEGYLYRVSNVEARDDVDCGASPNIYWSFGEVDFLGQ